MNNKKNNLKLVESNSPKYAELHNATTKEKKIVENADYHINRNEYRINDVPSEYLDNTKSIKNKIELLLH